VFLVDHQDLERPAMLCPFRGDGDGSPATCLGEPCALWYRSSDADYSGCAPFVTAFYSCSTSYNTRFPPCQRE